MPQLLKLRKDVQEHARAEERYQFTHIRRSTDAANLAAMAKAIKAAEATAPTRPHPGVESGAKNMALRTGRRLMDRTKDAVRRPWARTDSAPSWPVGHIDRSARALRQCPSTRLFVTCPWGDLRP